MSSTSQRIAITACASYFGGPIELDLSTCRIPAWASDEKGQLHYWFAGQLGLLNLEQMTRLGMTRPKSPTWMFYGGNMAFRRDALLPPVAFKIDVSGVPHLPDAARGRAALVVARRAQRPPHAVLPDRTGAVLLPGGAGSHQLLPLQRRDQCAFEEATDFSRKIVEASAVGCW